MRERAEVGCSVGKKTCEKRLERLRVDLLEAQRELPAADRLERELG